MARCDGADMEVPTIAIDRERLERVLDLQARAYAAVLWLNECAERDASLLSDAHLAHLRSVVVRVAL
jgi:hypothetical protein